MLADFVGTDLRTNYSGMLTVDAINGGKKITTVSRTCVIQVCAALLIPYICIAYKCVCVCVSSANGSVQAESYLLFHVGLISLPEEKRDTSGVTT